MKSLNEKFTDDEFKKLIKAKKRTELSWHDFIMTLAEDKKGEIKKKEEEEN